MTAPMLVFDMDGVLVDVTDSYRETIAQTVEHFTGRKVERRQIQEYKNQGGWNDDWQLSHHMVVTDGPPPNPTDLAHAGAAIRRSLPPHFTAEVTKSDRIACPPPKQRRG